jgi:osmoprotectant transport system substrate-binding protein
MRIFRKPVLGAAVLALALVLSACKSGGGTATKTGGNSSITVKVGSSSSFPENVLVAEMYAQVLEQAGFKVERHLSPPIQTRELSQPAIETGSIDLKPEYLATLLRFYNPDAATPTDASKAADALRSSLDAKGLELLKPSDAIDTNALVVTRETADKYKISKISDLVPIAGQLKWGVTLECLSRPLCAGGLKETYGITLPVDKLVQTPACDKPSEEALKAGSGVKDGVDVALLCSTQARISKEKWVILDDDKNGITGADNITPLVRKKVVNSDLRKALDGVSAALDTKTITELNARVEIDNEDEADVAKDFLTKQGLLKK